MQLMGGSPELQVKDDGDNGDDHVKISLVFNFFVNLKEEDLQDGLY